VTEMKMALMQPYLFPYLGYFQLMHAVDKFIFYDDVNFIKQGWINRNRILLNGKEHIFSVPIKQLSSYRKINETEVDLTTYGSWRAKFFKTITHSYSKAPYFSNIKFVLETVFFSEVKYIHDLSIRSVVKVCEYLGLTRDIVLTSGGYGNSHLKSDDRVLDICKREGAKIYINVPGGIDLYSHESFCLNGIDLRFIAPGEVTYRQPTPSFVAGLSIIDVLMFNGAELMNEEFLPCYLLEQ